MQGLGYLPNVPEILVPLVYEKFTDVYKKGILYRTTGVVLQNLLSHYTAQQDLFGSGDRTQKFELIHNQIDLLERKFGKHTVYLASTHKALGSDRTETDVNETDRDLLFL